MASRFKYLNEIQNLDCNELQEILKSNGYEKCSECLFDREIDGSSLLKITEFQIKTWRLPKDTEVWSCIKEIKNNPEKFVKLKHREVTPPGSIKISNSGKNIHKALEVILSQSSSNTSIDFEPTNEFSENRLVSVPQGTSIYNNEITVPSSTMPNIHKKPLHSNQLKKINYSTLPTNFQNKVNNQIGKPLALSPDEQKTGSTSESKIKYRAGISKRPLPQIPREINRKDFKLPVISTNVNTTISPNSSESYVFMQKSNTNLEEDYIQPTDLLDSNEIEYESPPEVSSQQLTQMRNANNIRWRPPMTTPREDTLKSNMRNDNYIGNEINQIDHASSENIEQSYQNLCKITNLARSKSDDVNSVEHDNSVDYYNLHETEDIYEEPAPLKSILPEKSLVIYRTKNDETTDSMSSINSSVDVNDDDSSSIGTFKKIVSNIFGSSRRKKDRPVKNTEAQFEPAMASNIYENFTPNAHTNHSALSGEMVEDMELRPLPPLPAPEMENSEEVIEEVLCETLSENIPSIKISMQSMNVLEKNEVEEIRYDNIGLELYSEKSNSFDYRNSKEEPLHAILKKQLEKRKEEVSNMQFDGGDDDDDDDVDDDDSDDEYGEINFDLQVPYYKDIDSKTAKEILHNYEDGAFLFIPSKYFLSLYVKFIKKIHRFHIFKCGENHDKIRCRAKDGSKTPEFSSLKEFVDQFSKTPLLYRDKNKLNVIYLKICFNL